MHDISIVVQTITCVEVNNHICGSKSMFVELDEYVGGDMVFGDEEQYFELKKKVKF